MNRARVSVVVPRHDADCEWKGGAEKKRKRCLCPKYLYEHVSRLRVSARTKSWVEAEELAAARERELNGEGEKPETGPAPGGGHLLRDVIEEYLQNFRQLGKSVDHYEKAERWIRQRLLKWMTAQGITRLHEITRKHLRAFRATWREEYGVSLISVQKATERMSSFFIWCVGEGYAPPGYVIGPAFLCEFTWRSCSQPQPTNLNRQFGCSGGPFCLHPFAARTTGPKFIKRLRGESTSPNLPS